MEDIPEWTRALNLRITGPMLILSVIKNNLKKAVTAVANTASTETIVFLIEQFPPFFA